MPPKVAAITMVYNEAALLPVWAAHYARQVGADYCYVVDHGSTDPVLVPPGMNVLRLPRSAHDDLRRAEFIGDLVAGLLGYFDWVLYTDVDELVIADPRMHANLPALCAAATVETLTCVGLDIQQIPSLEPSLDPNRRIGEQRQWARFTSAMCKPLLTCVPRTWSAGFHSADTPALFGPLYLFHLHWADQALGLTRLAKTRDMPWSDGLAGRHQRVADRIWTDLFTGMSALPRLTGIDFGPESQPLAGWLDRLQASRTARQADDRPADLHINAPELWAIPERFRHAF